MVNLNTEVNCEIVIEPQLRTRLARELRQFTQLKQRAKELAEQLDASAAYLEDLRGQTGAASVFLDGLGRITRIEGSTVKRLERKKLLAQGITPAMLDMATVEVPKRGFTRISLPGDKPRKDNSEGGE